ncbi:MAG: precorrin-6y C5,15-methyltransferase (decarboxylating) subunit CbiE, partial [Desulfobacterium sp.]|nr:precorrin-6y C5,15-methyltransferase (decarboxylating) subunit CbiE [Desulfobacterium sp.]MBU4037951.1 precorrin-6y C5,15-methyltransferase (decarboxylating) subunit CbiE [Pseudomonadota bacterium]
MKPVKIIGTGLNQKDLSKQTADIIKKAQVLVGGNRLLDYFAGHGAKIIPICGDLNEVVENIKTALSQELDVVVLADGDPGFYGIAELLVKKLGKNSVEIFPNITTLQWAASRLKIPWKDIVTVSLHGRSDLLPLLNSLSLNDRIGVFTDKKFNPAKIAEQLLLRGVDTFRMIVFENLCTEAESICELDLKDASKKIYSALNFIILDRIGQPEISLTPGMDEDAYLHQKGLITKKEVRAAGLAALKIRPDHTVWDLGAGCGSVAIEASVFAFKGRVIAVEKEPERVLQIKENIVRMGAYAVDAVCGDMPECLQALP